MPDLYTQAEVDLVANYIPLGFTERDPYANVTEAAEAILAVAAPLIAAKALRDAAADIERGRKKQDPPLGQAPGTALVSPAFLYFRAIEIEGKR